MKEHSQQKPVVFYGNGALARQLCRINESEGVFDIAAVCADREFIEASRFMNLPLVPFEDVDGAFPPSEFDMLVLVGYSRMRDRKRMFERARARGYRMANYVGGRAVSYDDLSLGENNLVFNGVYLGVFGSLGDNNIIRPNAYIGHDFRIHDHTVVAPGCQIAGNCELHDLCFVGVGATVADKVVLAEETLIAAGSLVLHSTEPCTEYRGRPAQKYREHHDSGIVID
jgi:sugar O-acyltransferase (sialic acid O-acetyltransferase NeuD family)